VNESLISDRNVTNARIRDLNAALKALCSGEARCVFVDVAISLVDASGNLSAAFQDGDGVHLNSAGNRIWVDELRIAVRKAQHISPPHGVHMSQLPNRLMQGLFEHIKRRPNYTERSEFRDGEIRPVHEGLV
jgi:hypothetical protein